MKYVLVTYERAHDAIEAMEAVSECGICGAVLIPRPRTLTAKCGIALRVNATAARQVLGVLLQRGLVGEIYASEDGRRWVQARLEQFVSKGNQDE